ncbi:MAG: hypothetical protein F2876_00005, partial [Actinobacteria bacterium]|nr:hypothetical protein [Actinomycetota bacterium]
MSATPQPSVVFFHAHPDDEAIFSGGTIARLAAAGHRVVVVMATSGGLGLDDAAYPQGSFATAEALVVYDEGGVYGHSDHVQVHRVGTAAAALARIVPQRVRVRVVRAQRPTQRPRHPDRRLVTPRRYNGFRR